MGRASLLGLCLNSLHKVDVWAYALGLRSGPMHILFSTPSVAPPSPWLKQALARAESFLGSVVASTWLAGDGLIWACSSSSVL